MVQAVKREIVVVATSRQAGCCNSQRLFMRDKIFISYRRDDARADARSIYQRLERSFGAERLFMDVDSIPRGSDFRVLLDRFLRQCTVLLVVIGRGWLDARDEHGNRRIDDPADFVRIEVAMALARKVAVIPVLLDDARMPTHDDLPLDLKPLAFRQAASVRHETFARDMDVLDNDIRLLVASAKQRRVLAWATLGLIALGAICLLLWPQLVMRSTPGHTEVSTSSIGNNGAGKSQITAWQKEVQPSSFRIEESLSAGRPARLSGRIREISKRQIELIIEPRSGTSASARMEALSAGKVDAAWETPTIWWRSSAAFHVYAGTVPLGLDNQRHARWLVDRGLRELNQLIREKLGLNIKALACYVNPPEGFWLRKPVTAVADLKGTSVRTPEFFFSRIAQRLGMKPVDIPGADFVTALNGGTIDGGEWSWPQIDYDRGLGQKGLHYYYPGFHTPSFTSYLFFNIDRWNKLPAATRGLIEEACRAQIESDLQSNDRRAQSGIERLQTRGVQVHAFPPDVITAVERSMRELTEEISAKDADFKTTWASYTSHR